MGLCYLVVNCEIKFDVLHTSVGTQLLTNLETCQILDYAENLFEIDVEVCIYHNSKLFHCSF